MTLLQITNRVLRRLREDTVTALSTSTYARLIGEFVSEIHQEVAQKHDWASGYQMVEVDCVVGQHTYDLSDTVDGTGDVISGGNVAANEYCEPQVRGMIGVYTDGTTDNPRAWAHFTTRDYVQYLEQVDNDYENVPCYVNVRLKADGSGYEAYVYPEPSSTYRLRIPMWLCENELVTDGTDDNTNINLPTRPIILGALYLALNERGEEIGEPGNIAEQRYYDALASAIMADSKSRQIANRYEWYRD